MFYREFAYLGSTLLSERRNNSDSRPKRREQLCSNFSLNAFTHVVALALIEKYDDNDCNANKPSK